jgi:hypothetical protein
MTFSGYRLPRIWLICAMFLFQQAAQSQRGAGTHPADVPALMEKAGVPGVSESQT